MTPRGPRAGKPIPRERVNAARFYSKTVPLGDCLMWVGAKNRQGYGRFQVDGIVYYAHRVAWALANGPIPDGMVLDHLCRQRGCVAVAHLEVISQAANLHRSPVQRAALNALKEACPKGHPYTEFERANGKVHRRCETCIKAANDLRSRAAQLEGLTQRQYLRQYGSSRRVAEYVIAAHEAQEVAS